MNVLRTALTSKTLPANLPSFQRVRPPSWSDTFPPALSLFSFKSIPPNLSHDSSSLRTASQKDLDERRGWYNSLWVKEEEGALLISLLISLHFLLFISTNPPNFFPGLLQKSPNALPISPPRPTSLQSITPAPHFSQSGVIKMKLLLTYFIASLVLGIKLKHFSSDNHSLLKLIRLTESSCCTSHRSKVCPMYELPGTS